MFLARVLLPHRPFTASRCSCLFIVYISFTQPNELLVRGHPTRRAVANRRENSGCVAAHFSLLSGCSDVQRLCTKPEYDLQASVCRSRVRMTTYSSPKLTKKTALPPGGNPPKWLFGDADGSSLLLGVLREHRTRTRMFI